MGLYNLNNILAPHLQRRAEARPIIFRHDSAFQNIVQQKFGADEAVHLSR